MPWHKSRIYYDHSTSHRKRILHRLDLSILIATAVLIVAAVITMGSLEPGLSFTSLQEICAICAIVCAIYLAIALFLRSRG